MLARDIMTRNVITVPPTMSVRNAALFLRANDISGLPVTGDDGAVCGMLTEGDLMRRVGNHRALDRKNTPEINDRYRLDSYLQICGRSVGEAIRTRLATDLGIGGDKVRVVVKDGLVQVRGQLASKIQRQAIRVLIERVRGIGGYIDRSVIAPSGVDYVPDALDGAQ